MQVRLPQWAQKLMDKHPGAKRPSVENPMPTWLEEELKKMPLWAYIRGADDVRRGHPYFLIEDVRSQISHASGSFLFTSSSNSFVVV